MLFDPQTYSVVISRTVQDPVILFIRYLNGLIEEENCSADGFTKLDMQDLLEKMCDDPASGNTFLQDVEVLVDDRCDTSTFSADFLPDLTDFYN